MNDNEAHAQAFENGRKKGDAEGYARGKAEALAKGGDLISRKAARETCQRIFSDPVLIHAVDTTLKNTPAVAAQPVKRGRWKKNWHDNNLIGHEYEECSACGCMISDTEKFWDCNYCPNCGARMDGGGHA